MFRRLKARFSCGNWPRLDRKLLEFNSYPLIFRFPLNHGIETVQILVDLGAFLRHEEPDQKWDQELLPKYRVAMQYLKEMNSNIRLSLASGSCYWVITVSYFGLVLNGTDFKFIATGRSRFFCLRIDFYLRLSFCDLNIDVYRIFTGLSV